MALEHLTKLEIRRGNCARARLLAAELQSLAERFRCGSELPFARVVDALCRSAEGDVRGDAELDAALASLITADAKHRLAFALNEAAFLDLRHGRLARAHERAVEALRLAELLELPTECTIAHVRLARCAAAMADQQAHERHTAALEALLGATIAAPARALAEAVLADRRAAAAE